MPFQRSSGILLHPTSLPARGGIGDFGPAAYDFVRFLAQARQGLWQVLPLGPTGAGNSPYSSISAFAGNPLLISLERLAERGWIAPERLKSLPETVSAVDYEQARSLKLPLLREAAKNFLQHGNDSARQKFQRFRKENQWWLDDFALFDVLRDKHKGAPWNTWEPGLARREAQALHKAGLELFSELEISAVIQFAVFEQWGALRLACARHGIRILGDIAIFVNYDSADVWCHPDLFHLDSNLQPTIVSGVPPDFYSSTGQRWGNPLYRWDVMRTRGYDWWIQRMRWALMQCDIVRIDHFRGFEKYWEIPADHKTAAGGYWQPGPGDDFFHALRNALGNMPLIAEDLGVITAEVHALRDRFQMPGMRVLQFGFSDPGARYYLPHRFHNNVVVYTGTHDNDTTAGWWHSGVGDTERTAVRAYFGPKVDEEVHWTFIHAAATSVADLCIFPLQDVLGLGSEARMNTPSQADGNWRWRYQPNALTNHDAERLAALMAVTDRDGHASSARQDHEEEFAA